MFKNIYWSSLFVIGLFLIVSCTRTNAIEDDLDDISGNISASNDSVDPMNTSDNGDEPDPGNESSSSNPNMPSTPVNPTSGNNDTTTVVDIQNGTFETGQTAMLKNVVVTAVFTSSLVDPTNSDENPPAFPTQSLWVQDAAMSTVYNGIYLFRYNRGLLPEGVTVGSIVDVVGEVNEFRDHTEIFSPEITLIGQGGTIEVATDVTATNLSDPSNTGTSEPYEGMLVELSNVLVLESEEIDVTEFDRTSVKRFSVGDASAPLYVYDYILESTDSFLIPAGTCVDSVRGVMMWYGNERRLYPRTSDDIQYSGGDCAN